MGHIHHHSKAIHFANDPLAEFVQAARLACLIPTGTSPPCTYAPRWRHVTNAKIVIAFDVFKLFIDRVAAFESHQNRKPPTRRIPANILSSKSQSPGFRMIFDKVKDRIDLFFSAVDRRRPANSVYRGLNPYREEFCIKSALFHPESIYMPIGESFIDIDTFINHTLRCVGVHINGDWMPHG